MCKNVYWGGGLIAIYVGLCRALFLSDLWPCGTQPGLQEDPIWGLSGQEWLQTPNWVYNVYIYSKEMEIRQLL